MQFILAYMFKVLLAGHDKALVHADSSQSRHALVTMKISNKIISSLHQPSAFRQSRVSYPQNRSLKRQQTTVYSTELASDLSHARQSGQ